MVDKTRDERGKEEAREEITGVSAPLRGWTLRRVLQERRNVYPWVCVSVCVCVCVSWSEAAVRHRGKLGAPGLTGVQSADTVGLLI